LQGRGALVVGGTDQAARKVELLLSAGAQVSLIAETVTGEIAQLIADARICWAGRTFDEDDLVGVCLVVVATADEALQARVSQSAQARCVPVNVVDRPALSSFIMPAIVDRDPIIVAIGTEGAAPILAREIKAKIESWLPANFGRVAQRAQALRRRVQEAIADPVLRRRTWEALLQGRWRKAVLDGDAAAADREFEHQLAAGNREEAPVGSVALIGCGPGEPDLITLKAQQHLQSADVLVVDRLVNPAILEYARRDAIRIDVGKAPEGDSALQEEINRILVREAMKGHRVVRLKGGDAFVFGRAAEEMAAVRAAGVPVEVVPGITAAHACAASIGLPVTLRTKVRQFAVVTGASADGPLELDWPALAQPGQAFAIYMGVRTAQHFAERLLEAGAAPRTPVVIVENGTLANERALATELASVARAIADSGIHGPAVIFVGLDWETAGLSRPDKVEVYDPQRVGAGEALKADAVALGQAG
jgi:uroporphyrin-III C-methyltransferase / precorrin-2 dehydrogenase / sirohydrochlorin ferrochelatase